eukprot:scaffold131511_cov63-Phaeocystis_antarctica.AAC.4
MEVLPLPPGPSGAVDVLVRPGGERRRRSSGVVRMWDGSEGAVEPQPARELREAAWGQILRVHHEGAGLARVSAAAPLRVPPFEVGIDRPHVLLDLVERHASRSAEGGRDCAALRRDIPARIEHNPRAREQPVDEIEPVGVPRREVRHPFRPFLPLARAGQRHQLFEAEDLLLTAAALAQVVSTSEDSCSFFISNAAESPRCCSLSARSTISRATFIMAKFSPPSDTPGRELRPSRSDVLPERPAERMKTHFCAHRPGNRTRTHRTPAAHSLRPDPLSAPQHASPAAPPAAAGWTEQSSLPTRVALAAQQPRLVMFAVLTTSPEALATRQ